MAHSPNPSRSESMTSTQDNKVLVLCTCDPSMKALGGFQWPQEGPIESPIWDPNPRSGKGLRGILWGEGEGITLLMDRDAVWLVVEVAKVDMVLIRTTEVKFQKGTVVYSGGRGGAASYIKCRHKGSQLLIGDTQTVKSCQVAVTGFGGTSTSGDLGQSFAGDMGTAVSHVRGKSYSGAFGESIAGDYGLAVSGKRGKATAGKISMAMARTDGEVKVGDQSMAMVDSFGTVQAGENSMAMGEASSKVLVGDHSYALSGAEGTSTSGAEGMSITGPHGKAIAGPYSEAWAGVHGEVTVGNNSSAFVDMFGKASAGVKGSLTFAWYDSDTSRTRYTTVYVGEGGILPDTLYKVTERGIVVLASEQGGLT